MSAHRNPQAERAHMLRALTAILTPGPRTAGTINPHAEIERNPATMAEHAQPEPPRERINVADTLSRLDTWTAPSIVVDCAGCKGHGKVNMTVNDLLRESLNLVEDPDGFVIAFYRRLFNIAPTVQEIFPPDLLTSSVHDKEAKGTAQRDRLVSALLALAENYGRSEDDMNRLDAILRQAGRSHVAFWRESEGRTRPASRAEYEAVWQAIAETFAATLGDKWRPEYGQAWAQAYDHAEVEMRHAQNHEGRAFTAPRLPRSNAR